MKSWPTGVPRCDPRSARAFEATFEAYVETERKLDRLVGYQKRQTHKRRGNLQRILTECYGMNPAVFRTR